MSFNFFVHQRLGKRWVIPFVVAVFTVANHVNNHIPLEAVAVVHGQLHHVDAGLGIIPIHMENRHLQHARKVSAVFGAEGIFRPGGITQLVVNHHMHGTASGEPRQGA